MFLALKLFLIGKAVKFVDCKIKVQPETKGSANPDCVLEITSDCKTRQGQWCLGGNNAVNISQSCHGVHGNQEVEAADSYFIRV